ncbi:pilus assembly protein TadG-related protein [Selenihalanaerobacter shriftii]|uniref:Putative Flp pilus-assembly TadE/G-like n=1 Tax=Selenihalanaerobacter shriftii TaxID=142842 RepID=A0A1T4KQA4_9FIRM|nr:TadE/TadG family type IV pilus assembly protein [Selenihalanaerobacter shriftii]SJZ44595.1 Putative Flp pilus-assembly TadE/G-like [Selenihalanaerobacter shriftii]
MKFFRSEEGTVIVLVALMMTIFLGFLALVVDIGTLYLARVKLVNALDATALAGVQKLPSTPQEAREVALNYAAKNELSNDNITIQILDDNHQIAAKGNREVVMNFASIFGIDQVQITASSKAKVGKITAMSGVVPFGVLKENFAYGEKYYLRYGPGTSGQTGARNGNFGALALGGNGANNYEDNLRYGYDSELKIGQQVSTEPGNMAGPTTRAIEDRIDSCQELIPCTYDSVEKDCSRLIFVPVIDELGSGRSETTIVGFAAFFLEGTTSQKDKENNQSPGQTTYVEGRFISWLASSGEMGSEGGEFKLRTVKLVE